MIYPDFMQDTQPTAQWWQKAAQASIRAYCGWHVLPSITETITIDSTPDTYLILPSNHVTDVSSVLVDGEEKIEHCSWSQAGLIQNNDFFFPNELGRIQVTFTHGYQPEEVPQLVMLAETIARRARSMPLVQSQSVNGASASYFTAGGAPLSIALLDIEKQMLAPYKLNWGV